MIQTKTYPTSVRRFALKRTSDRSVGGGGGGGGEGVRRQVRHKALKELNTVRALPVYPVLEDGESNSQAKKKQSDTKLAVQKNT